MSNKKEKLLQITILKHRLKSVDFLTVQCKSKDIFIFNKNKKNRRLSKFVSRKIKLFDNEKSLKYPLEIQIYRNSTTMSKSIQAFELFFAKINFLKIIVSSVLKFLIFDLELQIFSFSALNTLKNYKTLAM